MQATIEDLAVTTKGKHGGPRPNSGRPTTDRDDVAVKIDRDVAAMARYIAETRRVPMAEYLTAICEGQVRQDFQSAHTNPG